MKMIVSSWLHQNRIWPIALRLILLYSSCSSFIKFSLLHIVYFITSVDWLVQRYSIALISDDWNDNLMTLRQLLRHNSLTKIEMVLRIIILLKNKSLVFNFSALFFKFTPLLHYQPRPCPKSLSTFADTLLQSSL